MRNVTQHILILILTIFCSVACSGDDGISDANLSNGSVNVDSGNNDSGEGEGDTNIGGETNTDPGTAVDISPVLSKFITSNDLSYTIEGDNVVMTSTGIPNHNSPYFLDTDMSDKYEAYNGQNSAFLLNPNRIAEQSYTFRIPLHPKKAADISATPMGPMGVSINGVPIYNQYAAGGSALDNEINSFDQYNGHPARVGNYHYHIEPLYLTGQKGENAFLGLLLDGFPVYGPVENGVRLSSSDLDDTHGHYGATEDFPDGIYHYHITADDPYINGDGFYGTSGTATN